MMMMMMEAAATTMMTMTMMIIYNIFTVASSKVSNLTRIQLYDPLLMNPTH